VHRLGRRWSRTWGGGYGDRCCCVGPAVLHSSKSLASGGAIWEVDGVGMRGDDVVDEGFGRDVKPS